MQILSNTLQIDFKCNPEDIIGLIVDGWRIREGVQGYCQFIRGEAVHALRFSDVRCSAATLAKILATLNELLSCVQSCCDARLTGELVFSDTRDVWSVAASRWAHGHFEIEWDHVVCAPDSGEEDDDE